MKKKKRATVETEKIEEKNTAQERSRVSIRVGQRTIISLIVAVSVAVIAYAALWILAGTVNSKSERNLDRHAQECAEYIAHIVNEHKAEDDIGRAVLPLLGGVLFIGIVNSLVNEGKIRIGHPLADGVHHGGIVFFKGFHMCQLSFACRRRCMVWLCVRSAFWVPGVRRMDRERCTRFSSSRPTSWKMSRQVSRVSRRMDTPVLRTIFRHRHRGLSRSSPLEAEARYRHTFARVGRSGSRAAACSRVMEPWRRQR